MNSADAERVQSATIGFDEAARQSEAVWGAGRLVRLVSPETRASWRRGWQAWRDAQRAGDAGRLCDVIGKMCVALGVMDREARARGAEPLDPQTWEAAMPDGRVLVVVRTLEAATVAVAEQRRSGRACVVWTVPELARVVHKLELLDAIKQAWEGATVAASLRLPESYADSWARADPMHEMFMSDLDAACIGPVEQEGA